jgi:hypothetical protein
VQLSKLLNNNITTARAVKSTLQLMNITPALSRVPHAFALRTTQRFKIADVTPTKVEAVAIRDAILSHPDTIMINTTNTPELCNVPASGPEYSQFKEFVEAGSIRNVIYDRTYYEVTGKPMSIIWIVLPVGTATTAQSYRCSYFGAYRTRHSMDTAISTLARHRRIMTPAEAQMLQRLSAVMLGGAKKTGHDAITA